jgi:hypothetical protein
LRVVRGSRNEEGSVIARNERQGRHETPRLTHRRDSMQPPVALIRLHLNVPSRGKRMQILRVFVAGKPVGGAAIDRRATMVTLAP